MAVWGVQMGDDFLSIKDFTQGDWAMLREIQEDIKELEQIECRDKSLLMAFIAFLHIKAITEETKRSIREELH